MFDLMIIEQLRFLRSFLMRLEKDIGMEWAEIEKRNEEGEFQDFGDYEAAMDYPLFLEKFTVRSIFNELNILAEQTLHEAAASAWRIEQEKRPGKVIPKPEWELPIERIWELIESYYNIRRSDLPGWAAYKELREINNAFKHRLGFRRFSDIFQSKNIGLEENRHKAEIDNTKKIFDAIEEFLLGVTRLTTNEYSRKRNETQ